MDAGNTTWIIRLESGIPKVEISQIVDNVPVLECPSEREMVPQWDSGIYLNCKRGMKINLIRIVYALCKLGFFVDRNGNKVPDYKVFYAVGKFLHLDLSDYSVHLNSSLQDGSSENKHLDIFKKMMSVIKRMFDMA